MLSALDLSTSALVAQRMRMNAISSNLANLSTTHDEAGEAAPYQPRYVVFQTDDTVGTAGAAGVRVSSVEIDEREPRYKYQPGHPDAIQEGSHKGYVAYPDINMMTEMTDAMEAARAYEANLGAIDIAKDLAQQTLRILV
ncbi:MAG: flagellar basal body rod protein FlgC [Rhodopirellula sp.]|nr:flagellar basal body rod protein FlgC [Rhodopirellula sp.]